MLNITDPGFTSVSICVICGYTPGFWTIWTVLNHKASRIRGTNPIVSNAQRNPFLHFGQSLRRFGESLSLSLFCFLIFNFQLGSRIRGRHPCAESRCSALALREAFRSSVRHGRRYNKIILDILDTAVQNHPVIAGPCLAQRHPAVAGLTRELARHKEQPVLKSASICVICGSFRHFGHRSTSFWTPIRESR